MNSSASNHVTGLESGSDSGWWGHTDGEGNSSSTSWGGPWGDSYDETVNEPGFYAGAYYGLDYGGGREEYFAYLGDAFHDPSGPSSAGMFWFAYGGEGSSLGQSGASPRAWALPGPSATSSGGFSRALSSVGAGDEGHDSASAGGLYKTAGPQTGHHAKEGSNESFEANAATAQQGKSAPPSQRPRGWWESFKEWLWSWFSEVGAPPVEGALEAAPGVADTALNRVMLERAYRMEVIYGAGSEEAKYAWQQYEAYKAGNLAEFSRRNPPPKPRPGFPPFRPAFQGPRK